MANTIALAHPISNHCKMESEQKGESIEDIAQVNGNIVESPIAHGTLNASGKHRRQRRGKNRKVKYSQVWDWDNLIYADSRARKGKAQNCCVRRFDRHWWRNMTALNNRLAQGDCETSKPTFTLQKCERKNRLLTKVSYTDHIMHHAFMQTVYEYIYKSYYYESAASITGRGIHYSVKHLQRFIALNKHRTIYWVQLDFKKCYHHIKREGVQKCFDKMFNDRLLRKMAHGIIYAMGDSNGLEESDGTEGMGIGLYPIQPLVNFRYNELDRELAKRVAFNLRYCDNIVMCAFSAKELWEGIKYTVWYSENRLEQPLHTNFGVQRLDERHPIDFVGYKFYPTHTLLRDDIKNRFKQKCRTITDETERYQMLTSYKGWLQHCDGLHLWQTTTGMKSFSELGIKDTDTMHDGKRYFNVKTVSASFLVDRVLIVKDFEENVETKQGGGRMCILVEENEEDKKFITNNPKLKDIMLQVREKNEFPFKATLKSKPVSGNKIDYYFE